MKARPSAAWAVWPATASFRSTAPSRKPAAYGRVIDGLDGMVDKAPADLRAPARKGLDFAREKPLLTVGIIAGAAAVLSALGRKR